MQVYKCQCHITYPAMETCQLIADIGSHLSFIQKCSMSKMLPAYGNENDLEQA